MPEFSTYSEDRAQFESILDETGVKGEAREHQLRRHRADYMARRRAVLDEKIAQHRATVGDSYMMKGAEMVGAVGMGALDTATFGRLPQALGKVPGLQDSARRFDLAFDVAKETNPMASGAGNLAGYFVGPMGLAAKLAGRGAATVTGTRALAAKTAESHFAARAAAHTAQNIASGAGAIGAEKAFEMREDGADWQQRMVDAVDVVKSPMFLVLSPAAGALSASLTHRPPPEMKRLFNKYERLTGEKVPVEVYTDSKTFQDTFETLRHVPGVSNDAVKAVRKQQDALLRMVDEMVRTRSIVSRAGAEQATARAAAAARKLSGIGDEAGAVTATRNGMQSRAAQQYGADIITPEATRALRAGMNKMIRSRASRIEKVGTRGRGSVGMRDGRLERGVRMPKEGTSTQMYIDKVRKLTHAKSKVPLTVHEMEASRRGLSKIAKWDSRTAADSSAHSNEAVREARMLYDMLGSAIEQSSSTYHDVVIKAGRGLRQIEKALPRIKADKVDDAIADDFLSGGGVFKRMEALQKFGAPDDFNQMLGHMVWKVMRDAQNPKTGVISSSRLQQKLSGLGSTNRQLFDKYLPGVRQELTDAAAISEEMVKGLMKAEGAVTARKMPLTIAATASSPAILAYLHQLFTNPVGTIGTTMGAIAIQTIITRAINSTVVPGRGINQTLQGLARGAPRGLSRLPVAASNAPIIGQE
jgi:hypothetical protein